MIASLRCAATGVCFALLAGAASAAAQDAHYWSQQYGTRSELLGGTVVGSPQDLSTTYYNPGGLAFLESQSFLLSALALEYETYEIQRSGSARPLAGDRFGPAPILFSGTFPSSWTESTIAYSFLSRQKLSTRIDGWEVVGEDPDGPAANLLIDLKVSENWGGLTWAQRRGGIGFGVSAFVAYRTQRGREETLSQPIPGDAPVASLVAVNDYSYWHVRALAKMGVYWAREGATIGLTVTTPGLPLFGGGEAGAYRRLDVLSPPGSGIDEAVIAPEPEVAYRSPMSVAFGSRLPLGRGALYFTAEWFDGVERYRVLEAEEVPRTGIGSSLDALLTQELDPVLNAGLGAQFEPRGNVTFFGSVITDFGAATADPATGHSFATWDIYQFSGGAAFTALRADFTLGLSWGAVRLPWLASATSEIVRSSPTARSGTTAGSSSWVSSSGGGSPARTPNRGENGSASDPPPRHDDRPVRGLPGRTGGGADRGWDGADRRAASGGGPLPRATRRARSEGGVHRERRRGLEDGAPVPAAVPALVPVRCRPRSPSTTTRGRGAPPSK